MKHVLSWALLVLALLAVGLPSGVFAAEWPRARMARMAYERSQSSAWHGDYYDSGWGVPVAQVVPPTAAYQTHWGWGVGNTRVTPIDHQFQRNYPGPFPPTTGFQPTPAWPSDTDQFGVYYVRGPW
ncbi:MAG: hypothetical protein ACLQNE_11620 [Thermoguttaceae bacterium]